MVALESNHSATYNYYRFSTQQWLWQHNSI